MSIDAIEALFDDEQFERAYADACAQLDGDGSERIARSDRFRLARLAGLSALRLGRIEEASARLAVAWRADSLDADVCAAYGHLLFQLGRPEEGAPVFESLLVHHRDELTDRTLGVVLRSVAQYAFSQGEHARALELATQATAANPQDLAALSLQLDALMALGRPDDASRIRGRLIADCADPSTRAVLRRAQAQYLEASNDADAAAHQRFEAWRDDPMSVAADSLAASLETVGRYEELAAVLAGRAEAASGAERAQRMVALADVLDARLGRPHEAAEVLEAALDADIDSLEPFERLTAILARATDWNGLHDAYARTIQRVSAARSDDRPLLAMLWRNLGELCRLHLDDAVGARTAYATSLRYRRDRSTEDLVLDLSARVDAPEEQIASLRAALASDPERPDRIERLGALWLQSGARDRGYTALRLLPLFGAGGDRATSLVDALDRRRPAAPAGSMDAAMRRALLRPAPERHPLDTAFAVCTQLLDEHLRRDTDDYGIGERDRLDAHGDLLACRALRDAARAMDAPTPPAYVSDAASAVGVVWLGRPAIVVPRAMLAGVVERELRYALAERVALVVNDAAILAVLPTDGLKLVLAAAIHVVRPDFEIGDSPQMRALAQAMKRAMRPHWREPLTLSIDRLFENEALSDVDAWYHRVHVESALTAYAICDCPRAAMAVIERNEPQAAPWLRQAIVEWTLSDAAVTARAALGLTVA